MKFNRKCHTSAHAAVEIRPNSPPPQLKSALRRLGVCVCVRVRVCVFIGGVGVRVPSDFTYDRSEQAWRARLSVVCSSVRQGCDNRHNAQRSHDTVVGRGGNGRIQEITHCRSASIAPSSWNPYET